MLSHPAVRRLFIARLLSMATAEGVFFVGIWGRAAFEMDATAGELAWLMLAFAVAGMAGGFVAGPLVDRVGPRRVLVSAELAMVPSALALLLPDGLVGLTAASALWACTGLVAHTAMGAVAPFVVRGEEAIARANAAVELTATLAFVIGPAAAALASHLAGLDAVFLLDAVSSLVAAAVLWRLVEHPAQTSIVSAGADPDLGSGVVEVDHAGMHRVALDALADPRLRFLLVAGSVTYLSFGVFAALEPLFFREVLRTQPETLGWVNSVVGVGLLLGTLTVDRAGPRLRREVVVVLLTACGGIGAVAYTATASLAVVVAAALGWGAVLGALLPTLRTLVQLSAPPSRIGRMSTLVTISETAGDLVPLLIAPTAAGLFGVQPTLVASGVVVVVLAAGLWPSARRLDRARPDVTIPSEHLDAATPPGPPPPIGTPVSGHGAPAPRDGPARSGG